MNMNMNKKKEDAPRLLNERLVQHGTQVTTPLKKGKGKGVLRKYDDIVVTFSHE